MSLSGSISSLREGRVDSRDLWAKAVIRIIKMSVGFCKSLSSLDPSRQGSWGQSLIPRGRTY